MSDDDNGTSRPPGGGGITFTRKRTTTKTRTAATSARRRKNIPVVHAGGGGGGEDPSQASGKDANAWFARKSAGWTDAEIQSHLVSGGVSQGGKSFSMVGDVILGGQEKKKKKGKKRGRAGGVKFAWEEEEDEGDDGRDGFMYDDSRRGRMAAAPVLEDIMDEQDEIDFMSPLKVGKQYQMKGQPKGIGDGDEGGKPSDTTGGQSKRSKLRSQNAALAELAQVSGMDPGGGSSKPTSANESIGWRLLRTLGYRSRLGVAFVPLNTEQFQQLQDVSTPSPLRWMHFQAAGEGIAGSAPPPIKAYSINFCHWKVELEVRLVRYGLLIVSQLLGVRGTPRLLSRVWFVHRKLPAEFAEFRWTIPSARGRRFSYSDLTGVMTLFLG